MQDVKNFPTLFVLVDGHCRGANRIHGHSRSVFSAQEAARETEKGKYGNRIFGNNFGKFIFNFAAFHEVVLGLQPNVSGEPIVFADIQRFLQSRGRILRGGYVANLAFLNQLGKRLKALTQWCLRVIFVGVIEVDMVSLKPREGVITGGDYVLSREPGPFRQFCHFGRDDYRISIAMPLHPIPDDGLALATHISIFPFRVNICRIDEISAMHGVGIEYIKGFGFSGAPSEDIASKAERVHGQRGLRDSDHWSTVRQDWPVGETTGGFRSVDLAIEAATLILPSLSQSEALEIGEIAASLGRDRALPIAIEVRLKDWTVFHASLPGSSPENDRWIARKARVVLATQHSTMFERVLAEEQGINWYETTGLPEETHAIHGGGLALNVKGLGFGGILLISGLPQVEDHLLGVEVIAEYLARKGELQ